MLKVLVCFSALVMAMFASTNTQAAYTHHSVNLAAKQYSIRSNKWESTFVLGYTDSTTTYGDESSLSLDSEFGWGFNIGYNVNAHIAFNYEFNYTRPDYTATFREQNEDGLLPGKPKTIRHTMDMITNQFSGVYNFSKGRFSPYVQAGLGWTYMDSNIASGPPSGYCWWTPWGYYCDYYQNSFSDTRFSYNGALGVRYDFGNNGLIKASYSVVRNDMKISDDLDVGMFKLEFGSTF